MKEVLGKASVFVSELDPLGLLYIAAVVEKSGRPVEVLDAYIEKLGIPEILKAIETRRPDVIGISCLTANGAAVYALGRTIKERFKGVKVVLGNIHASVFAKTYLAHRCADAVVHGEGEHTFIELLDRFEKDLDLAGVKGISWWNGEKPVDNEPRELIADLDDLPMPARHLVDSKKYSLSGLNNFIYVKGRNEEIRQMFTSRGCVYKCLFCVVHKKYRVRSARKVVDEMELLVKNYNAGYIFIMDSLFIADKKRVVEICSEIVRRGLKFKWGCEGHINIIDEELLRCMEAAGCYEMHFGIESGAQHLLDRVSKHTKIDRIIEKITMVKTRSKIKVAGLFMLGLPGETVADSMKTIAFAKSLPIDFAQFSITVPYPGSLLFDQLSGEGKIETGVRKDGSVDLDIWERYSAHSSFSSNKPIYVTEGMTADELKRMEKLALRSFYLRPRMILSQMRRIRPGNLFTVLRAFKSTFLE